MSYHFEVGQFHYVPEYEQWLNQWAEQGYELVDVHIFGNSIVATMKGDPALPGEVRTSLLTSPLGRVEQTPIPPAAVDPAISYAWQDSPPGEPTPEEPAPRFSPPRSTPGRYG